MQKIYALITKELKSHLDNLSGYFLIALFLLIIYYFFLKTFFINAEVSVQTMFSDLSWVLCIFVAAITMNSFAAERDKGTIEYLLTKPLTIAQLLWGKILGSFIYTLIPIALTLPLPIFVSRFGTLDFGEVASGYVAVILLDFALVCLGTAFSALVKKPVIAFLLTALVLLLLNTISSSFFATNLNPAVASFFARFGLMDHYFDLVRGVVSLTDLAYFALLAGIGLVTGYLTIYFWRFNKFNFPGWQVAALVFGVVILGFLSFTEQNLVQFRLDLTTSRRYTISQVTKDILHEPGKVKVDVYISDNLPSQFQSTVREIKNTLSDYSRIAGSNLELNFINPAGKETELEELGIIATPFSIVSENNFQQQKGYVAAHIENEDGSDDTNLNFAQIANIDYELTKAINRMKPGHEKIKVGYTTGAGELNFMQTSQILSSILANDLEFEEVDLPSDMPEEEKTQDPIAEAKKATPADEKSLPDLNQYAALIIVQPSYNYSTEATQALENYYDQGGKILYLAAGNQIEPQMLVAMTSAMVTAGKPDPIQLFSKYGLTLEHNVIGDYKAYSLVNGGQGSMTIQPFEYWPRAQVNAKTAQTITGELPPEITLFWPSGMNLASNQNWFPLYQTTEVAAATQSAEVIDVAPKPNPPTSLPSTPKQHTLAALRPNEKGGKLLAVSAPLVFNDQLVGNSQAAQYNLIFGMMALENLTAAQNLSEIHARQIANPHFIQDDSYNLNYILLQFGAPAISVLLLAGLGYTRIHRRHQLLKQLAEFA